MRASFLAAGLSILVLVGCRSAGSTGGTACASDANCDGGSCVGGICQPPGGPPDASNSGFADGSASCVGFAESCTPGAAPTCCSGVCREGDGGVASCAEVGICNSDGLACSQPTDCCSLHCTGGRCSATQCLQIGSACTEASQCCTGSCGGGLCARLPSATCGTLGEGCGADGDCCSRNCREGRCESASTCSAAGDICFDSLDCCNGGCDLTTAGVPGTCALSMSAAGSPNCAVGGEPCDGNSGCCSRLCLDLGSGQASCVLGSGCRQTGEVCSKDVDCCGWDSSRVVCSLAFTDPPIGRCTNGTSCQPVGNCCGLFGSSCSQDCCDGKKAVCRFDLSGLSRCYGGVSVCANGYDGLDPDCCIPEGEECQFRDQCCGLAPCVQVSGRFVCQSPQCVPAGSSCASGASGAAACCNGLSCLSSGELGGLVCRATAAPGGADAGVPGDGGGTDAGPACSANGASCTGGAECCSGTCFLGICGSCRADGAGCTGGADCCSGACVAGRCAAPQACVNADGTCSGTAECCPGLTCVIAAGQANGACRSGSSCSASGQICSASQACCQELRCANLSTGATCAGGEEQCACRVVLN